MKNFVWCPVLIILSSCSSPARSEDVQATSKTYRALVFPLPVSSGTWGILDRDGANRQVDPYLSSLVEGEVGTGTILSPVFSVEIDKIEFTIRGHDGQGGGQMKNFIALADDKTGSVLRRELAPGADPLQARSWDVGDLRGRKVRIQVRDGIAAGAYAWLGIGKIDAGPELQVDFRKGMPPGWEAVEKPEEKEQKTQLVEGGIPFRALRQTAIPKTGAVEVPCGFTAERLFVLGCTVFRGRPLDVHGTIAIHYRSGPPDRHPLLMGYTLEGEFKLLSKSKAMHLHYSGDPFQYYLVLKPREEIIEKVRLERNPKTPWVPWISAVTVETEAASKNLEPLPDCKPGAQERAWIQAHIISPDSPTIAEIEEEIRRVNKM